MNRTDIGNINAASFYSKKKEKKKKRKEGGRKVKYRTIGGTEAKPFGIAFY